MKKDQKNSYMNLKKYIKEGFTLKKAPTVYYNQEIYNRKKKL